jgi:hypothetical protein
MRSELTTISVQDLENRLREYEARFDRPTRRLHEAFMKEGRLEETDEFLDWSLLFEAWKIATRRTDR